MHHERDLLPTDLAASDVTWEDGVLSFVKRDKNSAAYLVTFEF